MVQPVQPVGAPAAARGDGALEDGDAPIAGARAHADVNGVPPFIRTAFTSRAEYNAWVAAGAKKE